MKNEFKVIADLIEKDKKVLLKQLNYLQDHIDQK